MDCLRSAIELLVKAVHQDSGASAAAATVLLFGWNSAHPIRGIMSLDRTNRAAALMVIEGALKHRLNGGMLIEQIVGWETISYLAMHYGANGSAWKE